MSPFVLSVLKYSLLVLLYFFVFRAIRSVAVDVGGRKRAATTQMRTPAPSSAAKRGKPPTQVVVHDAGGGKPTTTKLRDPTEIYTTEDTLSLRDALPIYTAELIPTDQWRERMWFHTWI